MTSAAATSHLESSGPSRLRYLDGYRGLAALAVLAYHVAGRSRWVEGSPQLGLDGGAWMARLGNFGVCVFFLLSGLVLYRPFVQAHLDERAGPRMVPYLRRRLVRIFPAYILALTAFYALGLVQVSEPITKREYLWQYLLLHTYVRRGLATSLPVAWTLCVEMAFYLVLPILALCIVRLPGARSPDRGARLRIQLAGLAALYALGWVYRFIVLTTRPHWPGAPMDWLPAFIDWFALGMGLVTLHVWRAGGGRLPGWLSNLADTPWLCWFLALQLYWLGVQNQTFMDGSTRTLARAFLNGTAALLILLPAVLGTARPRRTLHLLESPVFVFLGTISYGIYLWHVIVIRWSSRLELELGFAELLVLTTAATVALAYASRRLVEAPAMSRWTRRASSRSRVPATAVAPAR